MRLTNAAGHGAGSAFPPYLLAVLLLSLAAAGCENTCVGFSSNAGTGTVVIQTTDAKRACTFSSVNGTVRVQLNADPAPSGSSAAPSLLHIFASLRGVEASAGAAVEDASPNWQELAPKLARQPVQLDLLARAPAACASAPVGEAAVPAGVYRQVRLLLVPGHPAAGQPAPAENACAAAGYNCVVTASGNIMPLALDATAPELLIDSAGIEGGLFSVLPDARAELAIQFRGASLLLLPAVNAVHMVPVWSAALRRRCEPDR